MADEQNRQIFVLKLTELQFNTIYALFGHNNWNFEDCIVGENKAFINHEQNYKTSGVEDSQNINADNDNNDQADAIGVDGNGDGDGNDDVDEGAEGMCQNSRPSMGGTWSPASSQKLWAPES